MPFLRFLLCFSSLAGMAQLAVAAATTTFYVAPDGNDEWSGRLSSRNAAGTDGPLATLERAQDKVRSASKRKGVTVVLRGGVYPRTGSLRLGRKDSGTRNHPVVWRGADGEKPTLSGGVTLFRFERVDDAEVRARITPAARDHVVWTDLRRQGLTDYGTIEQRGSPGLEVFYRGQRQPLARYPNGGWLRIAGVPQTGAERLNEGLEREKRFDGVPAGRHYGRIAYAEDRPNHWAPDPNIFAHGYWVWDWSDSFQQVSLLDPARHELTFAAPHHHYGYAQNQRYYFLNVLEELDEPGEWYLDRQAGRFYFYPPAPLAEGDVQVSMLNQPFIVIEGAHDIAVEELAFTASRGSGVVMRNAQRCRVSGGAFTNLGDVAADISGGEANEISSSDFHDLARGAINVSGGDRRTLRPSRHRVINNHIHHFSQWLRTGQYGIFIDGVGQRVAQNLIHDAPFEAMYLRGNDHVIELNEIHSVTQETGDAGGIHTGRDWTWRGHVIRHNYWHHLKGPGVHGVTAVYLDDFSSGFSVTGNIFYRAGRAVQIGGGRDNLVANNLFVECEPAVHVDARGLSWAVNYFDGRFPWMFERFREMKADRPPYATRYPALKTILRDDPAMPKGNRIVHNISWGGRWLDVYDYRV
ncbi:MAG TPA: right-handed parallel beta-helix repeat-containing protein, partial [Opitutus sp.]|nr:right-handed parallel beta-helix repeat-containing protein [Opitutus sp.]